LVAALLAVASAQDYPKKPAAYDYVSSSWSRDSSHWLTAALLFVPQPPMPYAFAYAVKDDPSYNDYGHKESSDGKVVSGSYRVLLPDGRTQIVNYKVDGYSGYVADVVYEGVAKPYDYKPYKPAPYKP
jgi:Insect cuticle protein